MKRDGFQRTLREHGDRVYSYAAWLLGDREEARDVVQDGLMRLWRERAGVADRAGRSWLMRTVHRLCIDRLRRRGVQRETGLDESEERSCRVPVERSAELSELQAAMAGAMSRMLPRDRALIVMREMQEMSYQEMSDVLDIPVNTLKPAVYRARERLREELSKTDVTP
jgi:RNA polymerase sigma-70 factor (ECF subfamily)